MFVKGYEHARQVWSDSVQCEISILHYGSLCAQIGTELSTSPLFDNRGFSEDAVQLIELFTRESSTNIPLIQVIMHTMGTVHSNFDWGAVKRKVDIILASTLDDSKAVLKSPSYLIHTILLLKDETKDIPVWTIIGALLGVLDEVIGILLDISDENMVRTPIGESIEHLVLHSLDYLEALFDQKHGLQPGNSVRLCVHRLAGVSPAYLKSAATTRIEDVIEYWNGQQGILLTPVFKRSLLWDLPEHNRHPLTFHNIPIMGIPTDEGGWIKVATVTPPVVRRNEKFTSVLPVACKVIMQYRPYFEVDSTSMVAAVYLDGVFYHAISLKEVLGRSYAHPAYRPVSECEHFETVKDASKQWNKYIALRDLDPGIIVVPKNDEPIVVVGPQLDRISRLFTYLIYEEWEPIIQNGCVSCTTSLAKENKSSIVISRLESDAV